MTFWRGETLAANLPSLIDPYHPERIDCSAYTLSVGSEIYVTPNHEVRSPSTNTVRKLKPAENFTIPSGQFGFIITEEIVEVPDTAMAFISMKTLVKFQGLINASGFHVDPGYKGRLIFSVFNAGPSSIHLKQGLPLFLIWYANLDEATQEKKSGLQYTAIPPKLVHSIDGKIHSAHSLSQSINEIKTTLIRHNILIGILVAIIVGAFILNVKPSLKSFLFGTDTQHEVQSSRSNDSSSGVVDNDQPKVPTAQQPEKPDNK